MRKSKGKQMKPNFFVFCEGETEIEYVKFLRSLYRVPIQVIPKKGKINISEEDIEHSKREYVTTGRDRVFLIYDLDVSGTLDRLRKIHDVELLVSNPCIELWFLLHYQERKTEISTDRCLQVFQKVSTEYRKGVLSEQEKSVLSENRFLAVERAKGLIEYHNPSSTVYRLLERLDAWTE